jgi:hypothetical protein
MSQQSEAPTQPNLSTEDRLLGVLYQFVKLHECWTKDWSKNRKELDDQMQQLEKTIQALFGKMSSFSKLESTIQQQVQGSIHHAGIQIAQAVKEETRSLMNQTVYDSVHRLSQVVREVESLLQYYRSQTRWQTWKVWGGSLVVALGVGVLVSWLLMPTPTIPLTDSQQTALMLGRIYQSVWPKLPPEDKEDWEEIEKKMGPKR